MPEKKKPGRVKAAPAKTRKTAAKKPAAASPPTRSRTTAPEARKPARKPAAAPTGRRKPAPKAAAPKRKPAAAEKRTASKAPARRPASRAPKPKAAEALYSGKVFRSRLEARWAILLDLLDINWDYEPSHYQVGPHLWYLPDFYLPQHRMWLEVKGAAFMDAQSMAKILATVAGPMPVPLREEPYTASTKLLIGGSLPRLTSGRPVHTLVTPSLDGRAALTHATFGREGAVPVGEPWDIVEADGIPKSRRPAPGRMKELLEPDPIALKPPADVAAAYRFAATAAFDDTTRTLAPSNDDVITSRLSARRSGRPLGPPRTAAGPQGA
ncbi:hypothetical protein [Arthrobacter caoxuetaonis]|uniref:Uncharacterized protein n=1 Tax=Arthrobacter caoxuetaonis TaxID=2886935 RepID=A0A9X1MI65_9MICC|nr:hypothetical protein [Arthrobacter caoxuetaonis]MCC3299720.1 hypothetical protein [Arthrobacter caoxuetaonis]USQ59378.1 hypothetical protein NF551_17675 [Arthrobacter caoxuetaonis]